MDGTTTSRGDAIGEGSRFIIRDSDGKYGELFDSVAGGTAIEVIQTPPKAPRANAICERFLGSVRREALDHILIVSEHRLKNTVSACIDYFNASRPHQGLAQLIPTVATLAHELDAPIVATPILGGLHHDYRRAA